MKLCLAVFAFSFLVACGGGDPNTPSNDRDDDGIIDTLDSCPDAAENKNGYLDLDGCPDTPPSSSDADRDGIPDAQDACPSQPETVNGYQDSDGCPDTVPDADGDGVPDSQDACPSAAETINGNTDSDGCPDLTSLYSGRWSGQATLQFEGEAPWFNNTVVLTGALNNQRVTMSPVCPLGDGALTTTAFTSQYAAQWAGSMDCAPIAFSNGCQYVVLTYTGAAFDLATDGRTLGAAGGGTATGCGITKRFVMTFSGVRQ